MTTDQESRRTDRGQASTHPPIEFLLPVLVVLVYFAWKSFQEVIQAV